MITNVAQAIVDIYDSILNGLMGLALSPFERIEQMALDNTTLSMIKWIFPLGEAVALLQVWGAAIVVWYIFKYVKNRVQNTIIGMVGTSTIPN
jgi:hypothetical protein